jgi:hypothetical protein
MIDSITQVSTSGTGNENEETIPVGGFTQIPNSILRNPDLSHGALRLYVLLRSYGWQDGFCFPGQERLAAEMGVGPRMVYKYMKELEAAGLIRVRHRPLHKGVNKTNVYTFTATDRKDNTDPERHDNSDDEYAVDKNSISPLSPPRGADEDKKEKAGSVRGPSDTSSFGAKRDPAQNRAGEGKVKERSPRKRSRSRAGMIQTPDEGLQALTDHRDRLGGQPLKGYIPVAKRWDFTKDNPPWWVMKELDNDHRELAGIERIVRGAVREAEVDALNAKKQRGHDHVSPDSTPDASLQATQDLSLPSHPEAVHTTAQGNVEAASAEEDYIEPFDF